MAIEYVYALFVEFPKSFRFLEMVSLLKGKRRILVLN